MCSWLFHFPFKSIFFQYCYKFINFRFYLLELLDLNLKKITKQNHDTQKNSQDQDLRTAEGTRKNLHFCVTSGRERSWPLCEVQIVIINKSGKTL